MCLGRDIWRILLINIEKSPGGSNLDTGQDRRRRRTHPNRRAAIDQLYLTRRQLAVLDVIADCRRRGFAPTDANIARLVPCVLSGVQAARGALVERGLIREAAAVSGPFGRGRAMWELVPPPHDHQLDFDLRGPRS